MSSGHPSNIELINCMTVNSSLSLTLNSARCSYDRWRSPHLSRQTKLPIDSFDAPTHLRLRLECRKTYNILGKGIVP
jgi:hypothetical protein